MMGDWGDANRGQSPAVWVIRALRVAAPRLAGIWAAGHAIAHARIAPGRARIPHAVILPGIVAVAPALAGIAPTRPAALVPVIAMPVYITGVREAAVTIARTVL